MKCLRMLVTDLDGTLIGQGEEPEDYLRFRRWLNMLRGECGLIWTVATGRHRTSMQAVLGGFVMRGLIPDFLVLEDARIYKRTRSGAFRPFYWWNFQVGRRRAAWRRKHRVRMDNLLAELTDAFPAGENLAPDTVDVWIRLESEEEARSAEEFVLDLLGDAQDCLVFRWGRELYVGPAIGTKGEAVRELMRRLDLERENVLAVGDGPNDISMLDGSAAGLVMCVANASDRVREVVEGAGGYVARRPGLKGVLDGIERFAEIRLPDDEPGGRAPDPAVVQGGQTEVTR